MIRVQLARVDAGLVVPAIKTRVVRSSRAMGSLRWALLTLAVIGVALVILSTSRDGIGLTSDSYHYISAARSLLSGDGYVSFDGQPYTNWGPLFPTLLAGFGLLGVDPLTGARFLNAAAFGVTVLSAGTLFRASIRSKLLALLGTISVVASAALLYVSTLAMTEAVFISILLLFTLFLSKFLNERRPIFFWLLTVTAAAAILQRYVGFALIVVGIMALLSPMFNAAVRKKTTYALVFAGGALTPITVWMIRNFLVTSGALGERAASLHSLVENVGYTLINIAGWFVPWIPSGLVMGMIGLVIVISAGGMALVASFGRQPMQATIPRTYIRSAVMVAISYSVVLIVAATIIQFNRINVRLTAPLYPFVMLFVFVGIEEVAQRLHVTVRRPQLWPKLRLLATVLVLVPVVYMIVTAATYVSQGPPTSRNSISPKSALMMWLQDSHLSGTIHSNAYADIFVRTDIRARASPSRKVELSKIQQAFTSQRMDDYIVWFNEKNSDGLYEIEELIPVLQLREVADFSDGVVYLVDKSSDGAHDQ